MSTSNLKTKRVSSRRDSIHLKTIDEKHYRIIDNPEYANHNNDVSQEDSNPKIHFKIKEQMRNQLVANPEGLEVVEGDFISEHLNQISFAEIKKHGKKRNQMMTLLFFLIVVATVITSVLTVYTKF